MYHWDKIHSFKTARFEIEYSVAPEDMNPRDSFDETECADIIEQINCSALFWFIARVRVLLDGREISADYLGGCCYESPFDFIKDGYYRDMVKNTIIEARQALINSPKIRAA